MEATVTTKNGNPTISIPNPAPPATTVPLGLADAVGLAAPPLALAVLTSFVTLTGINATPLPGYAEQFAFESSGQLAAMQILCSSGGALMPFTASGGEQRRLKSVSSWL